MNDNHLQQLLLQTEVTPPENRWEMIVVVLDEMDADIPLQQKILSTEITAPFSAWDAIEQRLDDHFYIDLLEHATAEVPVQLWEQINTQLDEITDEQLAAKLIAIQENPPTTVWKVIDEQLSQNQPAKVIPFKRSYKNVYRLAAAAIITGILALSGYWLLNKDEQTVAIVTAEQPAAPDQKIIVPLAEPVPEPQKETASVATNSRTNVKKRIQQELNLKNAVAYAEPVDHSSQTAITANDIHHQSSQPVAETTSFAESQYFVVLNESGDLVRVSKKISNLKCLNSSNTAPVDAAMVLQTKDCTEQIKRWQQKIAMSATLSASAGYIDLNEIINNTDQ